MDHRDLQLSLVQDLLAAPGSREGWASFLRRLCDAFGGSAANFISHDFLSSQSGVSVTARTDPEALGQYLAHWCLHDPWARSPVVASLQPGEVVVGPQLIDDRAFQRSAFLNDFSRGYDIEQCLAGVIEVVPGGVSVVSINASGRRRRFDTADAGLLQAVMPPLKRALDIHRRLSGAELLALHGAAVLDRLPHAVFLLSATGDVVSTNRAGDEILRARDGLTSDARQLRGATPAVTSALRSLIANALQPDPADGTDRPYRMVLPRPSGRRPMSVVVSPLPRQPAGGASAVMFVTDPDAAAVPDVETIRGLLHLTPAEAALVQCLAQGLSLEQSAARLGVRIETLRSRLKVIFQKTETHRQADVVRLVMSVFVPRDPTR